MRGKEKEREDMVSGTSQIVKLGHCVHTDAVFHTLCKDTHTQTLLQLTLVWRDARAQARAAAEP